MSEIGLKKSELDTPVLWVDLDRLDRNIAGLAAHFESAGVQWRPHMKGVKIPAIAHKVIDAGAIGVTCAKLGEAEVMASAGIQNILVANQVVGPKKITRLVNLRRQTDVIVAVDDPQNVQDLGQAARLKGVELGILVEVNTGMNRAGTAPGEETLTLSRLIHETDGLRYLGLMAWEGHTAGMQDFALKQQEIEKAVGQLSESVQLCREAGLPVEIVSGGGSGTYRITPFLSAGVTEMQAGGVMFNDATYQSWGVETEICIFVRSMVTSRPTPERIIFDAGFKTLPAWDSRSPKPVGLSGFESFRTSAEHGTVTLVEPNSEVKIGESFDFILGYTDMTVFLHDNLYGIRDGIVEVIWPIAGRGKLR